MVAAGQRVSGRVAPEPEHPGAALYVYKGSLSPRAVLERLERFLA